MPDPLKKFRFGFRLLAVFWQKHRLLIGGGIFFGVLFFFFAPKLGQILFLGQTKRIGLVGKFTTSDLPLEVQQLISDGLTTTLPDGQAFPCLAASWETLREGKEYIFTLKENIFWQTGEPVLAKDINYNFNDVAFSALEGKKVKFELKEPFVPFPTVVSRPLFKKGLVGTSQYKVKSLKANGEIIETLVLKPVGKEEKLRLIFRFYPTEGAAKTGFKLGEIDILKELASPGELLDWQGVKVEEEVKQDRFAAIFFNTRSPKLAEKSVRQTLAYAVDKHWQPRAINSLNPESWAYNSNVKPYDFDLEKAQELWEKTANQESSLTELELSTTPSLLSVGEEIKNDWEKLGIKVNLKLINSLEGSFEALLAYQEIPADPDQYLLWHSTQPTNISGYQSPKLDKLLEEGRKTLEQQKRKEIYQDFQRFLVEDTPAIFLFHPVVYTITRE